MLILPLADVSLSSEQYNPVGRITLYTQQQPLMACVMLCIYSIELRAVLAQCGGDAPSLHICHSWHSCLRLAIQLNSLP